MQRIVEISKYAEDYASLRILKDKEKIKTSLKESFGLVYSGRVTDMVVNTDDELSGLTHYLLRIALGADCDVTQALTPSDAEIDRKAFMKLLKVVNGFVTHSAKMLYPSAPANRFVASVEDDVPGLTSRDAVDSRPLYFGGNAADSSQKYFWTTDFTYNQQRTCLAELIARENPVVLKALSAWRLDPQEIEALIEQARLGTRSAIPDHAYQKQVLLPVYDEADEPDYIAVTPIPSVALSDAIGKAQKRFYNRFRQDEGLTPSPNYIPGSRKSLLFGGTKPQNINDFASSVGGYVPVLECRIPKVRPASDPQRQIMRSNSLFRFGIASNPEAEMIDRAVRHQNQIPSFVESVEAYVEQSLQGVLEYAEMMQQSYDEGVRKAKAESRDIEPNEFDLPLPDSEEGIPGLIRAMLSQDRLTPDQVERFAKAYIAKVRDIAFRKTAMTDMALKQIRKVITRNLMNWRNPVQKIHG